ncbi:hypothetical protein EJB05_25513, partial [Eragrostis curvula]
MAGQQRRVVLPVRALDGRTTAVRILATASVRDLKATLIASFPPAQTVPSFHLFLRGGKLLLDAKLGNIVVAHGEFITLISFSTKPPDLMPTTTTVQSPAQSSPVPTAAPRNPRAVLSSSAKKRKFSSSWRGEDVYARVAGTPSGNPASPSSCCHGVQPLDPAQMVEHLKQGLGKQGQVAHVQEIPGREVSFSPLPAHLSPAMRDALKSIGVSRLYSHQAQAIASAASGKHVVISTATSSGKSLCYNVPVLESVSPPGAASCALYIFPTKALAQDQLKTLLEMKQAAFRTDVDIDIYDGDTPMKDRARIRDRARLLITNPDMLHVSVLPCHAQFRRFLSNLRYIVIDEAHSYKGAFGCHTALILRRLKRICQDVYGSHPTFIFCTATLANPREHVMELAKLDDVELVSNDGSPCGSKHFLLWNPSVARSSETRCPSPIQEVSYLFAEMVQHGLRCIAFCKTRKLCELVLARTREILEETTVDLADSICVYRGGYVAEDRRRIEADLFGGKLRGVAATNALELGIDVGHIDATLHLGFPGSIASFWQQAGRSGRRSNESIAVYVAFEGALDQYFMKFPHKLFGKPVEHCQVDSNNHKVLEQHLACAAFEKPLHLEHDETFFGSSMANVATALLKDKGSLANDPSAGPSSSSSVWKYVGPDKKPSSTVSIRAIEHDRYKVIDQQGYRLLEEIEESKAFFQVYEGAVYMHQGVSYLVERLNLSSRIAYCRAAPDLNYYTKIRDHTDINVLEGDLALPPETSLVRTSARANDCKVTTQWLEFRRIWKSSDRFSDTVELDLPSYSFDTQAAWIGIPQPVRAAVEQRKLEFHGGVHAASHALLSIVPLHIMCSASDLGTRCHAASRVLQSNAMCSASDPGKQRADPQQTCHRILLYDKHPGGIGLASQVKLLFGELLVAALELVSTCSCTNSDGCPNCIQSFACGEYNKNLDKQAALLILKGVIQNEGL